MKEKTYLSKNGNQFTYRNTDISDISPLEAGYIITPSGDFIPVKDSDDYSTIFSEYISKYVEHSVYLDIFSGAMVLAEEGHVVYVFLEESDVSNTSINDVSREGILLFPNIINNGLSAEQREACMALIKKLKLVSNDRDNVSIKYYNVVSSESLPLIEFSEEEILDLLSKEPKPVQRILDNPNK